MIERADLVSLADRLGALQLVRLAMAAAVLASAGLDSTRIGLTQHAVAPVTAIYVLFAVGTEVARRVTHVRGLGLIGAMLLVDGVYLAAVLAPVGGPHSALIFLVYVHVIAVTLLTSWRTGLKLAVWHSILMVVGYWADLTALVPTLFGIEHAVQYSTHDMAISALGFWVVAIGTATFSRLSERELRRGKAELGALAAMGAKFEQTSAPTEIGAELLTRVLDVFGFPRAAVATVVGHGGWALRAERSAKRGGRVSLLPVCYAVDVEGDELVAQSWARRDAVLARSLDDRNRCIDALLPGAVNVVVVPLVADGSPVGALIVERGGGPGAVIARTALAGVMSFAAHAALALRSAWLVTEIERLARFDALTGLANRRVFEAALTREVARSDRSREPLSLVMIDVDHFKSVNDTLGHQAGDEVLRHVSKALAGEARETDLAARYGGEEFCVLLPGCGQEEAVTVAERLRAVIAAQHEPMAITASAGVATLPFDAVDGRTLVAAADGAMYEAKRSGRDRTCAATAETADKLSV